MAIRGTVGSMTGDAGVGAGDTTMVGGPGADEGNADGNDPAVRCADGVCLRPHADFLLVFLAFFRSSVLRSGPVRFSDRI